MFIPLMLGELMFGTDTLGFNTLTDTRAATFAQQIRKKMSLLNQSEFLTRYAQPRDFSVFGVTNRKVVNLIFADDAKREIREGISDKPKTRSERPNSA